MELDGKKMIKERDKAEASASEYHDEEYESKERFCSYWHQIDEVRRSTDRLTQNVLVVGKGSSFVDSYLLRQNFKVSTLDIDPSLNPTFCASVLQAPFADHTWNTIVCCQVLEHLPFEHFHGALLELRRLLTDDGTLILSLPDLSRSYRFSFQVPGLGEWKLLLDVPIPNILKKAWQFNGEHHWNIGNKNFPRDRIRKSILQTGFRIAREYAVFEMKWHRFFIAHPN